ncbi:hypothetical protein [Acidicapsa ligni]|uniref:hypothetical protein n=1 Tax=Acidicapsa ligni TaxID=542300 RepID=UPI0021DFA650|nr:hypothetical protein [Acidicapsa ligni]
MNQESPQSDTRLTEAEHTLRLLANLPPPEGLTDRIHHRLRFAPEPRGMRFLNWRFLGQPAMGLQFAGAALVLVALAGGSWSLYHRAGHVQAVVPQTGNSVSAPVNAPASPVESSGFRNAGAVRVPPTLTPLHVPPVPKKKPSAGHAVARHVAPPQADAAEEPATQP